MRGFFISKVLGKKIVYRQLNLREVKIQLEMSVSDTVKNELIALFVTQVASMLMVSS